VLLMGFFSVYCGFIYNDFASMGLNLFQTCYDTEGEQKKNCVYLFGIDPIWHNAENELQYMNSYKMKMAVIIGFLQMSFGLILRGINLIHFKERLTFLTSFLPQVIFMSSIFGYMIILIISKWNQ
jgi:V-type H+-transporting ATPase subunit a